MTILARYDLAIEQGEITNDPLQRQILPHLQRIADELSNDKRSWLRRGQKKLIPGIYLYGPVGAGKTYLIDLFYDAIGERRKARFHFHHFMQQVDAELRRLQGQQDPLRKIAANLAKTTRVLCLDEFLVHDIADAMILGELLQNLIAQGVILVATSNTRPDDLYLNGLQRIRFLPAIDLLKRHCEVLVLADNRDYRLGRTPLLKAYLTPLSEENEQILNQQFHAISANVSEQTKICIQNREIPCIKYSERAIWFNFDVLCNIPRSQLDYLEIAGRFETVFVSKVPVLSRDDTTKALLFMHFIDVMYDKGVRVILSAAVGIEQLYSEGAVSVSFQRTLSRLHEMQSIDYLRRHKRREDVQMPVN
ncbi:MULTISPECIES: cell division protein ZapE [Legionella]|uniref:Cell division protein ZapE n=1 Tax=Legionella septentrionalis TaxID=2498109 RepID=A0A3S0XUC6_9GAMM|nr:MULTISPECIES: cell division protein ZapE [Legionella]MCP0913920.1 cell division protein ZapE [Legionella sp. 27cVA30]RUQ90415.1 cell division protein ZapE [Legionella septentrionalis]RUR10762.1 cell division protein ZapE [Legionella septentrionalis]RUR16485.1 cell division protein ZapE [Legionella septentrionalis]